MRHAGSLAVGFLLLTAVRASAQTAATQGVQWQTDPLAALRQATATERPLLMKFTAEWCGYCKKMERTTFSDRVTAEIVHRSFVPVLIDADQHRDLVRQLRVRGLPTILIVAPDTTVLDRITGYQTTQKLIPKLNAVIAARRPAPRVPALPAAQERTTTVEVDQVETQPPALPDPAASTETPERTDTQHAAPAAFDGLCLTSVVDNRELISGSHEFPAEYHGHVLHFCDAIQRRRFFRTPEKYWPAIDGLCAVTLHKTGKQITGRLRYAAVFQDRIWLFQNRECMMRFIESPAEHVAQAEQLRKQMNVNQ